MAAAAGQLWPATPSPAGQDASGECHVAAEHSQPSSSLTSQTEQDPSRWNAAYIRAVAAAAPARHHAECQALRALQPHARSIAVVGNGPLSGHQRQQIASSDVVVRFNEMNFRCAALAASKRAGKRLTAARHRECGERLDVWIVRFANHRPLRFHGLDRTWGCNVSDALASVRSIWFLNGETDLEREAVAAALGNLSFLQVPPQLAARAAA